MASSIIEPELEGTGSSSPNRPLLFGNEFVSKAAEYHGKLPVIRRLPLSVIGIIGLVGAVNIAVWIAVGIVLHFHGALISTAVLSYTLGLRHALDADHISAIDLMTRRLIASGRRPVTVGTFFSLGHSTIVIITSIVVAATAEAISHKFDTYSRIGGIIGTAVSAGFLIILGLMNIYILYKLIQEMRRLLAATPEDQRAGFKVQGGGCLFQIFKGMFRLIDRPWKMYPLGVLFGLGFDTSSEIALLGIASIQGAKGTSIWLILLFPLLFTAGMCLIDTTDGALMMTLYTSTSLARDPIAIAYYSIVLTAITVLVALIIGTIQLLTLVLNVAEPTGSFWDGVNAVGDNFDIIGGAICGAFIFFGTLSVVLYKPWRRWADERYGSRGVVVEEGEVLGGEEGDGDEESGPRRSGEPMKGLVEYGKAGDEERVLPEDDPVEGPAGKRTGETLDVLEQDLEIRRS